MSRWTGVGGFVHYHVLKTCDLGRAFIRLVLEAYHTETINFSDVAEILGVKLKHLPTIAECCGLSGLARIIFVYVIDTSAVLDGWVR